MGHKAVLTSLDTLVAILIAASSLSIFMLGSVAAERVVSSIEIGAASSLKQHFIVQQVVSAMESSKLTVTEAGSIAHIYNCSLDSISSILPDRTLIRIVPIEGKLYYLGCSDGG